MLQKGESVPQDGETSLIYQNFAIATIRSFRGLGELDNPNSFPLLSKNNSPCSCRYSWRAVAYGKQLR